MKLIKAFVRNSQIEAAVRALEDAGAPGITVSRVHGVGYGYDPYLFTLAPRDVAHTPEVAKVEVVCCDKDVDRLLSALLEGAHTGVRGDGIVFVSAVERSVRIRTGEEGESGLCM